MESLAHSIHSIPVSQALALCDATVSEAVRKCSRTSFTTFARRVVGVVGVVSSRFPRVGWAGHGKSWWHWTEIYSMKHMFSGSCPRC